MKTLLPLFLLALVAPILAQQPDRWRGLIIDETTPEQAIAAFGQPNSDKTDSLRIATINRWLTKAIREKKYRRLEFKKVEDFDKVTLAFNDGKLVLIELDPQKMSADAFSHAYKLEMRPIFSGFDEAFFPKDFYRNNGQTYARSYPTMYSLVGVAEKTFVMGNVANNSFGQTLKKSLGGTDSGTGYPGKMQSIQLISRTLENKDGVDVLK